MVFQLLFQVKFQIGLLDLPPDLRIAQLDLPHLWLSQCSSQQLVLFHP
jgi:hypothetical protein